LIDTGREGVSGWVTISQERIDAFAEATDDRQWIHVDAERARRESPYGATVAHGFLTLSLISSLLRDAVHIDGVGMGVNYGLNRVRFPAPVVAGSRVRGHFRALAVEESDDGVKVTWSVTVEREGGTKPCCVGEWITMYYEVSG